FKSTNCDIAGKFLAAWLERNAFCCSVCVAGHTFDSASEISMKDVNVQGIFPTPVYFCELERGFTAQEMAFFEKQRLLTQKNVGNSRGGDSYILNKPEMAVLKSEMTAAVQRYAYVIMGIKTCAVPFITQSWLNYTEP